MGAVDLVIQVESPGAVSPRPAAHRSRRAPGRRAEPGQDLPEAPRRPARGGGRRAAHASTGSIESDAVPAQPARRAGAADRRHVAAVDEWTVDDRSPRSCGAARTSPSSPTTCSHNVLDLLAGPLPVRRVRRAAAARRVGPRRPARCGRATARSGWPSPAAAPSPTAACSACSCPTAPASASSTRRWSTRAGPARRSCSARPRGGSRTSPSSGSSSRRRRASPARCRSGTATGRVARSSSAGRSARSCARCAPWPPTRRRARLRERLRARRAAPRRTCVQLPRRAGRGHRRRARRPHDRRRALPRRDRRLARVHPHAVRHAGARAVGDGDRAPADRALRHAGRDDVERRRHRPAPARGRRRAARSTSCSIDPDEIDELVVGALPQTSLFASRFRECAARALLLPRRRPDSAHAAVAAAPARRRPAGGGGEVPDASRSCWRPPRECLQDVFDVPALREVLGRPAQPRASASSPSRRAKASPFAQSLLFGWIAVYMYEGDAPLAERRAAALALDRDLLRDLLGAEELRELLDPDVLADARARAAVPRRRPPGAQRRRAARPAAPARRPHRGRGRCCAATGRSRRRGSTQLVRDAAGHRGAGGRRGAARRGRGRGRATATRSACDLPLGLPHGVHRSGRPPARDRWSPATPAPTARSLADVVARRLGVAARARSSARSTRSEAEGRVVRGEFRPGGVEREWCDADVLRQLRRRSLAALRREVEPVEPDDLRPLPPGVAGHPGRAARARRARRGARAVAGRGAGRLDARDRGAAGAAAHATAPPISTSCAPPATSCGSVPARSVPTTGASGCTSPTSSPLLDASLDAAEPPGGAAARRDPRPPRRRAAQLLDPAARRGRRRHRRRAARRAVGSRVGRRGHQRLAGAAARRRCRAAGRRARRPRRGPAAPRPPHPHRSAGRCRSLVAGRAAACSASVAHAGWPTPRRCSCSSATASSPARPCSPRA